jgi:hypothetical protein
LTEVSQCGDLTLFVFDLDWTMVLELSRPSASKLAYEAGATTTYEWDEEDGVAVRYWSGADWAGELCSGFTSDYEYQVVQGSLVLKVSPTELEPTDSAYPIRASVIGSRVGLTANGGDADPLWISTLDLSWLGDVAL